MYDLQRWGGGGGGGGREGDNKVNKSVKIL